MKTLYCSLPVFLLCLMLCLPSPRAASVIEQYVGHSDSTFDYRLVETTYNLLYTTYIVEIDSQAWQYGQVMPWKWQHWLVVVEPRLLGQYTEMLPIFSLVRTDLVLMHIIRGDATHTRRPSGASSTQTVMQALLNGSLVAELHGVPVGPIAFNDEQEDPDWWDTWNPFNDEDDDLKTRIEDGLQARSFDLALDTGDYTWALMAPMAKSIVLAMDVMQELADSHTRGFKPARRFVLAGHSKRAMAAWLAAAFDPRVAGVAAFGYDMLNMPEQIALQEASWAERSPELTVYDEFNLYQRFKTPNGRRLLAEIDPYSYLDRISAPVLILTGTRDNYSNVDSINLYYDDIQSDVRLFYDAAAGHNVHESPGAQNSFEAFYRSIILRRALPAFSWSGLRSGFFAVSPRGRTPLSATLWSAVNSEARDFRESAGIDWTSSELTAAADGTYSGVVAVPESGYSAYFIELTYHDGGTTNSYGLATPVTVLGD